MAKEGECVTCGKGYSALNQHYRSKPSHKPDHWGKCPSCGERYSYLAQHWRLSDCEYPKLTQYQYEVLVGLMMGDGSIDICNKEPCFECSMITKKYIGWLDNIFGILGTGVKLQRTAEEGAKQNRDRGFNPNAKVENYSDLYRWRTRSLPELDEFAEWYDTGSIVWPENIDLTPTVLKHWYVSDGHYDNKNGQNRILIALLNEIDNEEKIVNYFEDVGLPRPNRWQISDLADGRRDCTAVWNVDESQQLLEYMLEDGDGIPPGFEYKWPKKYQ